MAVKTSFSHIFLRLPRQAHSYTSQPLPPPPLPSLSLFCCLSLPPPPFLSLSVMNVTSTDGGCWNSHTHTLTTTRWLWMGGGGGRGGGKRGVSVRSVGKRHAIGGRRGVSACLCPCLCSVPGFIPTKTVSVPPAVLPLDLSQLDYCLDSRLIIPRCHI